MEEKFERTKSKIKKVRFNSNTSKMESISSAGDLNGCVLVVPEIFGMNEPITLFPRQASRVSPLSFVREGRKTGSLETQKNTR